MYLKKTNNQNYIKKQLYKKKNRDKKNYTKKK